MLFEDNIIFNGDDCLTIGSPVNNIHFRNSYCNGGHGLSIGSLGKGGAVADVQNVLYVIRVLGRLTSLTSPPKDRKCYHGRVKDVTGVSCRGLTCLVPQENSIYGARFKSWTGGNGIARKCDGSLVYSQRF